MTTVDAARARENLWESLVYPFSGTPSPETTEQKQSAALAVLHLLQTLTENKSASSDPDALASAFCHANAVWQLLASEIAPWLQGINPISAAAVSGNSRVQWLALMASCEQGLPRTHRSSLDSVSLQVPRPLLKELHEGLRALGAGEVTDLMKPATIGRRDASWSHDQMRLRALEHVEFLIGQGVTKSFAQAQVAKAMKNVSTETLRAWEKRDFHSSGHRLEDRLLLARNAGKLYLALRENPELGKTNSTAALDSSQFHLLEILSETEPLRSFGDKYVERFGLKHNSRPDPGV